MKAKHFLVAIILVASPLILFATDYYIAKTGINVRTGAGKRFPISFVIEKGDEVEFLSIKGKWYKIKYAGETGYAYSTYLKYNRTAAERDSIYAKPRQLFYSLWFVFGIAILFAGFKIYIKLRDKRLLETVTQSNRGTPSERDLVLRLLKWGIPAECIFHDLYAEKQNGGFSQSDLVLITKVGIIMIEVKDYSGWIYGTGNQSEWTKVLAGGRQKYRFYNPIRQNDNHIAQLRRQSAYLNDIPFYSIIVFYGNCNLKNVNYIPRGTFITKYNRVLDVIDHILSKNVLVNYTDINEVSKKLREAAMNGGSLEAQYRHAENVNDLLGKNRIFE